MRKLKWLAVILIVATLFGGILGCKHEVKIPSDKTAPADVTELIVEAANGNAVLSWTNPADKDFAGVQISMSPAEGTLKNAISLGKDVVSFDVSGLTVGTEYTFTIKAFDTSSNYSKGAVAKATVADTSDKTAPADVTELTVTASNGNAVLNWTNPADTDFAGVQVAMSPAEGTLKNAVVLEKEVTSLDVSGLTVGTEYTFTVKTFDESLNYSEGAEAKATVADTSDKTAPANVTSLTVTASNGNAVLSWKNPADTDFAGVQISMNPAEGTLKNAVSFGKDVTSLDVSGLENGKDYTFTVKTFDTSLNYSEGAETKATVADTSDKIAPATVTSLTVTAADGNAVLTWTNPADTDFAGVQISMSPAEGTLKNAISLGKDVKSFDVSGLENRKEYTFTVKAFDTSLNYSEGKEVKATVKVTVADPSDKTAPADVTELTATNKDASVLLTWTDATDEDIYGYEVTWNKKAPINRSAVMKANSMMVAPGAKGCYISNLTNGTEYAFTVKSVDISGNKSTGVTKTITPSIIEKYPLEINFTKNITEKTNQNVVIAVDVETDASVKQITYVEGTESIIDTVLEGTNITEPRQIPATKNTTFTVAVTDTAGRRELAFVRVDNIDKTAPAQVADVIPIYSRNNNAIKLSWTNPADEDFAGTEIVYGKTGSEGTPLTFDKNTTSATIENIAEDDSEYTIVIKTKDDVGNLSEAKTVTVVATTIDAKITSVSIPVAGTNYAGKLLPVTIIGKDFTVPGVTASGFTSTDLSFNNVTIVSDTLATAEVICPDVVGTTNVTVSYGESSATTTLKVIKSVYSSSCEVGDIILTDGSKVSVANVEEYSIDEKNKPIGVVATPEVYGVPPKVIGLQESASKLIWAPFETTGHGTAFTNISCLTHKIGLGEELPEIEGDTDGSDNWEEICAVDPEGTQDPATYYPAFNFANTYGTTAGLAGTDYEDGWYVPSIAELDEVYKNKEKIQTSLTKANGFNFDEKSYWSSSQYGDYYVYQYKYKVFFMDFGYGIRTIEKNMPYNSIYVLVLQALTAE